MSARDDYPSSAANRSLFVDARWNNMCAEIDRLRDERDRAITAIARLHSVLAEEYDLLRDYTKGELIEEVIRLRAANAEAKALAAQWANEYVDGTQ